MGAPSSRVERWCGRYFATSLSPSHRVRVAPFPSVLVRVIRVGKALGAGGRLTAGDLTGQFAEHRAQVRAIPEQARGAGAAVQEKGEDRLVGLLRVASRTAEYQVVAPVVRGTSP